jgi:hypothetical protein
MCFIIATNMMLRRVGLARHASHAYFNRARDQDGRSYGEKNRFQRLHWGVCLSEDTSFDGSSDGIALHGGHCRSTCCNAAGFRAQVAATYGRAADECYLKLFQNCSTNDSIVAEIQPLVNGSDKVVGPQQIPELTVLSIMAAA